MNIGEIFKTFFRGKEMGTISINGVSYTGNSICIRDNVVVVDGVVVGEGHLTQPISVVINGNVEIVTTASGDITANGNVTNIQTTSGDVIVRDRVIGDVTTVSGDVDAGDIFGNVRTVSGDISKVYR